MTETTGRDGAGTEADRRDPGPVGGELEGGHGSAGNPPPEEEDVPPPVGTLFVMMIFLMVLGGMWAAIYFEFLGR